MSWLPHDDRAEHPGERLLVLIHVGRLDRDEDHRARAALAVDHVEVPGLGGDQVAHVRAGGRTPPRCRRSGRASAARRSAGNPPIPPLTSSPSQSGCSARRSKRIGRSWWASQCMPDVERRSDEPLVAARARDLLVPVDRVRLHHGLYEAAQIVRSEWRGGGEARPGNVDQGPDLVGDESHRDRVLPAWRRACGREPAPPSAGGGHPGFSPRPRHKKV